MYDSLKDFLGVCTVYGSIKPKRLITSGGAKPGDLILCTKPLGHETITNYALTHPKVAEQLFGAAKQQELASNMRLQSCVKEAIALAKVKGVHAMHDATEGGFVSALNELAGASKVGVRVNWESIPLSAEAQILKGHFGLSSAQMLAMSSTGTILAAVAPQAKQKVTATLQKMGLTASYLGEFTGNEQKYLVKGENISAFPSQADDPYAVMMATS
jgi:hydrogenase maturation factor